jgi:hypothetical protein
VPDAVLARRQARVGEQPRAVDARRLRRHRTPRQVGRQREIGRKLEVELHVRIAPRDLARRALEIERPVLVEAAPAVVGVGTRQRGGERGDEQEATLHAKFFVGVSSSPSGAPDPEA